KLTPVRSLLLTLILKVPFVLVMFALAGKKAELGAGGNCRVAVYVPLGTFGTVKLPSATVLTVRFVVLPLLARVTTTPANPTGGPPPLISVTFPLTLKAPAPVTVRGGEATTLTRPAPFPHNCPRFPFVLTPLPPRLP